MKSIVSGNKKEGASCRRRTLFPIIPLCFLLMLIGMAACNKEEEPRMPDDLIGIWSPSDSVYLVFSDEYTIHNLHIYHQDGESIGVWQNDTYVYEPGYNIVIYLSGVRADVYQIVSLSENELTWCPVEAITADNAQNSESLGHLIGEIIKEAQEGFKLDPELFQTYHRISQDDFFNILENLDITYPWDF